MLSSRAINYIILTVLLLSFIASLFNIKSKIRTDAPPTAETNDTKIGVEDEQAHEEVDENRGGMGRFVLPAVAMVTFFVACYFVSLLIAEGESVGRDKYAGIFFMGFVGLILTVVNFTVLARNKLDQYVKGKKFSVIGLFMALGVSSIVFGFLDNFGMKLGTEALDNSFLQVFLSPFSRDERFVPHRENIQANLRKINDWTSGDWRKLVNHTLRFEDDLSQISKFKDLSNAIRGLGGEKLDIPPEILRDRELTNQFVDNLRDKYDIIDGSKAMLGNTFSDFIGAILGAGLVNLFVYMTNYDGAFTGDDRIDGSFLVRNLSYYAPFMEALFIALGCLVPVFLNIAMNRRSNKVNNFYCWIVVGVIGALMVLMMYLSSRGVQKMTFEDKQRSIERTLSSVKERVDLHASDPREQRLSERVQAFIHDLRSKTDTAQSTDMSDVSADAEAIAEADADEPSPKPEMGAPLALPLASPRSM